MVLVVLVVCMWENEGAFADVQGVKQVDGEEKVPLQIIAIV